MSKRRSRDSSRFKVKMADLMNSMRVSWAWPAPIRPPPRDGARGIGNQHSRNTDRGSTATPTASRRLTHFVGDRPESIGEGIGGSYEQRDGPTPIFGRALRIGALPKIPRADAGRRPPLFASRSDRPPSSANESDVLRLTQVAEAGRVRARFGLTCQRIRQIEAAAVAKLRHRTASYDYAV